MPTVTKISTSQSWYILEKMRGSNVYNSPQIKSPCYISSHYHREKLDIFLQMYDTDHQHHCMHAVRLFSRSLSLPLALRHSHTLAHSWMHKNKHRSTHSHDSITSLSFLLTSAVSYLSNKLKKVWEISRGLELKNVRSDVRGTAGWVEEMERVHAEWRGEPETV